MSYREMQDLSLFWQSETSAGNALVMAEISATEGSTYRKASAKKLISASGRACGLLSGGCLETAIIEKAQEFLQNSQASLASGEKLDEVLFDTSHESDRLLGYQKGCQGKIWIRYQRLAPFSESEKNRIFPAFNSPQKVLIFGCGADTVALSEQLAQMGLPHVMCDHRKDLALSENFPKAQQVWHKAPPLCAELVEAGDAVLIMSHNYEADLNFMAALQQRLSVGIDWPRYIGFLGPRARFLQLCADLKTFFQEEWTTEMSAISHAPVGLTMPCRDPYDIALSIVSQISTLDVLGRRLDSPQFSKQDQT